MISLYFHIPFCTKKCPYCHFYVIPNQKLFQELLTEGLEMEWQRNLPLLKGKEITSIYFGGGTPSLYSHVDKILEKIERPADAEITIEANPEEVDLLLLERFRKMGINRLSLGIQSLDDRSLETLERIHSAAKAKEAIFLAKKAGFENVSIDLMYDLPGQTLESWRYTLDQLSDLPIQHLSLYNLTIEPHTPFFKRKVHRPSPDLSLSFLNLAIEKLEEIGLHRYEISAFAKKGYASRHNLGYWTARPFLGFGPSAFSFWEGSRFRNIANLHRYVRLLKEGKSPVDFSETLSFPSNVLELFTVQLRVLSGVQLKDFDLPEKTFLKISDFKEKGLLQEEGPYLKLTRQGMLFYDEIASELI